MRCGTNGCRLATRRPAPPSRPSWPLRTTWSRSWWWRRSKVEASHEFVMAGLDPPAGPQPLRRGEGPAIHVFLAGGATDVDARHEAGHDEFVEQGRASASALIQLDRRVFAGLVDLRAPDLVRGLVLGLAETERRAETEIEVTRQLERIDQLLGVHLRPGLDHGLDQYVGGDIALERDVVGLLAGEIFGERVLVFEHGGRIAADRRHHLRHDHAVGKARAE